MFGNNIKYLRESCGLTQKELGEKINYSEEGIRMWETRGSQPREISIIPALAKLFEVSCDELLSSNLREKYGNLVDKLGNEKPVFFDDSSPTIGDSEYGKKRISHVYKNLAEHCFMHGMDNDDLLLGIYFLYGAYLNGEKAIEGLILDKTKELISKAYDSQDMDLFEDSRTFYDKFIEFAFESV